MTHNKSISVFLPALNEQDNIKICVVNAKKYLSRRFKDYEIIVVSNGSKDNTDIIVTELAKKDKHIKLVNDKKIGYGSALRSGFKNSTKELIFYTDADNQFDIEEMDKLLPLLKAYDVVSGYRIKRRDPYMRIVIAKVYNILVRVLFNLKVRDIDASFKIYKRNVIDKIKLRSNTGLIDAEVLIKSVKNGHTIGQIGVTHYPRVKGQTIYQVSHEVAIVRPKVVINILKEIKALWKELR